MAIGMIGRGSALTPKVFAGARRLGRPRTDAERRKRHMSRFGTSKLPPRGTGLKRSGISLAGRRLGKPRTTAERTARHKSLYGSTKLPPRGTGLKRAFQMVKARRRKG